MRSNRIESDINPRLHEICCYCNLDLSYNYRTAGVHLAFYVYMSEFVDANYKDAMTMQSGAIASFGYFLLPGGKDRIYFFSISVIYNLTYFHLLVFLTFLIDVL